MGVEAREYRSPVHKLVRFFEKSRNQWKEKSVALRHQLKLVKNQVRAVEKSREQWRETAKQAIAEARAVTVELEELRAEKKGKPRRRTDGQTSCGTRRTNSGQSVSAQDGRHGDWMCAAGGRQPAIRQSMHRFVF